VAFNGQVANVNKKKVIIDGLNLALEQGTGIATYARNLSYNLRDLGCQVEVLYGIRRSPSSHPLIREISFFDAHVGHINTFRRRYKDFQRTVSAPFGATAHEIALTGTVVADTFQSRMPYYDHIWNVPYLFNSTPRYFRLSGARYSIRVPSRPDIAHWTYPLPTMIKGAKNIYTIHDLVPLRLPYTTLDQKNRYFKLLRAIAKRADHIVVVSECTKRDVMEILRIPEQKITVTYQSVEIPDKYLNKPEEEVRAELEGTFGLQYKQYFLFYGAIEPKKNIGRIIQGYLASSVHAPLVIAGRDGWKSDAELRLLFDDHIRSLVQVDNVTRVQRKVVRLDYVPFPLLVSLIRGAKALLFPSLYEGFGLPVLEAMLCGTPVLTSTQGATPEVAGDAALLVDPYDPRQIREGILQLDGNEELRTELVGKGTKQVAAFRPEIYQRRLRTLYENVL
jgi:glycosyltransferase involved in cell wall biosynthesis